MKEEKKQKPMRKFFGREHWIGARCIIGTTQAKPYFTRIPKDCNIKSMYINGENRNLMTYKTKLLAV